MRSLLALLALAIAPPALAAATPEVALAGFAETWNRHDMEAFANLFWDDATFVNRGGRLPQGRATIRDHHAKIHGTHLKDSRLDNRIESLRRIGDAAAVAIVRSDLSGSAKEPDAIVRTRLTVLLERRGTDWRIAAAHNVTLSPDAN